MTTPITDIIQCLYDAEEACPCEPGTMHGNYPCQPLEADFHHHVDCVCKGDEVVSRFDWARVECVTQVGIPNPHDHGEAEHDKSCYGMSKERCEEHRESGCPGHRPRTYDELVPMLQVILMTGVWVIPIYEDRWHGLWEGFRRGIDNPTMGDEPCEAALRAIAAGMEAR